MPCLVNQGSVCLSIGRNLLGLIDIDAFNRMNAILNTNLSISDRSSESEALEQLTSIVSDFYKIMDQIYIDKLINDTKININD